MRLRFDRFELDTDRYQLSEAGEPRAVEPKVFDLIVLLATHPQKVFSRDDLIAQVWAGRVVSDATVSTCIKSARKALGDSGGSQRCIRTLRGRGVCFAAEVTAGDAPASSAPAPAAAGAAKDDDQPSLLVLPFRALDASAEAALVADGLWVALGTLLTRVPLLRLSAAGARYRGMAVTPGARELHETLGVDYLLEGTTQQTSDGFVVNTQLGDARSGFGLWAERFVVKGAAAEATERALIAVVAKLEPRLHRALYDKVRSNRAEPSARALYLEASGVLALKGWHHRSFSEAAGLLRRSRRLDAEFALAPAYLALVMGIGQRVGLMVDREQAAAEALEAAERALELDAMSSTVLGFAGCALCDIGHLDRGSALLRNAVELEPANAQAWAALGSACLLQGNLAEAVTHLTHGIAISPLDGRLSVWGSLLALAHMLSSDLDAALHEARTACQRDHRGYLSRVVLSAVHLMRDEKQAAVGAFADACRVKPDLDATQVCSLVGRELGERVLRLSHAPAS